MWSIMIHPHVSFNGWADYIQCVDFGFWFCGVDVIFGPSTWVLEHPRVGFAIQFLVLGSSIFPETKSGKWLDRVKFEDQTNNSLGWSNSDPELKCHNGDVVRIQKLAKQGMRLHMFQLHRYTTQVRRFRNQGINGTAGGNRHGPYTLDHPVQNDRVR